jgi:hypothetical protein
MKSRKPFAPEFLKILARLASLQQARMGWASSKLMGGLSIALCFGRVCFADDDETQRLVDTHVSSAMLPENKVRYASPPDNYHSPSARSPSRLRHITTNRVAQQFRPIFDLTMRIYRIRNLFLFPLRKSFHHQNERSHNEAYGVRHNQRPIHL